MYGVQYDTCRDTREALGLLQNDTEWMHCFDDASLLLPAVPFRDLFPTMIVIINRPSNVPDLLNRLYINFIDDYCMTLSAYNDIFHL
ncbi:MAG: hypothetical protein ACREOZ_01215 [Gloeomargaritales cyanobacterium]